MKNLNRCETCDYKKMNESMEKGWCYMFREEPTIVCMKHSERNVQTGALLGVILQQEELWTTSEKQQDSSY